jgi:hypothetical protein
LLTREFTFAHVISKRCVTSVGSNLIITGIERRNYV